MVTVYFKDGSSQDYTVKHFQSFIRHYFKPLIT